MRANQANDLNVQRITVGKHAIQRAKERSEWKNLKDNNIVGNIRSLLKRADKICDSVDESGKPSVMYGVDGYEIHLSTDLKNVVTFIKQKKFTYTPLKLKALELHKRKIRGLERKENARVKYLDSLMYDCKVEIAELERRIYRTRSQSVRNVCEARIKAINISIQEHKDEIKEIQDEKRKVARSLIAII